MSDWYTDDFEYKTHTRYAVKVSDGEKEFWLPLSEIDFEPRIQDLANDEVFQISMPQWLAEEKGVV